MSNQVKYYEYTVLLESGEFVVIPSYLNRKIASELLEGFGQIVYVESIEEFYNVRESI
jgi:hypothetical protein